MCTNLHLKYSSTGIACVEILKISYRRGIFMCTRVYAIGIGNFTKRNVLMRNCTHTFSSGNRHFDIPRTVRRAVIWEPAYKNAVQSGHTHSCGFWLF